MSMLCFRGVRPLGPKALGDLAFILRRGTGWRGVAGVGARAGPDCKFWRGVGAMPLILHCSAKWGDPAKGAEMARVLALQTGCYFIGWFLRLCAGCTLENITLGGRQGGRCSIFFSRAMYVSMY